MRSQLLPTVLFLALGLCARDALGGKPTTRPVPEVDRLLLVSIDGLRPDLLARAYAPNLQGLMRAGSFTLWARTTAASVTLPSHMTMLTGVTPKRHEIEWNRDLPLAHPVYPKGSTLLDLAKRNGYSTALIAGKSKFDAFARPGTLDHAWIAPKDVSTTRPSTRPTTQPDVSEEWPDDATKARKAQKEKKQPVNDAVVAEHAVRILRDYRPDVTVVHFPHVDNVGHALGWGTPEQIVALEDADAALGAVLRALRESGAAGSTLILVTSDHGGAGRNHGPDDARSRHIPWIAAGPGVRRNFDLTRYPDLVVDTQDTFATACHFLALRHSPRIDGKAVTQIVDSPELIRAAD